MNVWSIIGFGVAIAVLFFGLKMASTDMMIFVNYPSMFIVIGGSLAATAICFRLDRMAALVSIFFRRVLQGKHYDFAIIIKSIMQISENYRKGENLEGAIKKTKDYFLQDALSLVNDKVLTEEQLIKVLTDRADNMYDDHMGEANKIKVVSKFPPAFGMMGTTIGMIVLLANLGGEDAIKMVGPAMAVALITTLYGVIIANLAVVPIAENLVQDSKDVYLKNQIIIEGMKLLVRKTNPIVVAIELNSFLAPRMRLNWKEVLGK